MAQISLGGDIIDIPDTVIDGYKNQLDIKSISDGGGTPSLGLFGNNFTGYLTGNNISLKNQNGVDFGGSQILENSGLRNRYEQAFSNNADLFNQITGQKQTVYTPGSLSSPNGPQIQSGVTPVNTPTIKNNNPQNNQQTQQPQQNTVANPVSSSKTQPAPLPQGNLTTGSIVDYLNSIGQNSSYASRAAMAQQNGIQGYTGTASQNTQLLSALRSARQSASPQPQQQASGGMGGAVDRNGMVNGQPANPKDLPSYNPSNTQTQPTAPDYKNTEELYADALKSEGVSEINTLKNKTEDEMKALQDKKDSQAQEINNNPWYSEGKRQLELKKLDSAYETKLNTLSNFAKLYDARYQDAVATAKWKATGMQEDQQFALNLAQKKQEALDKLAEQDIRPMSVNGREVLVDLKSQKIVADLGASKTTGTGGLTDYQQNQTFIGVTNKYQADGIVNNAIKGQTAIAIANQVLANPGSATNQLKSLYSLVKNLDPDSAVREGEVALANQTTSYLQRFQTSIARITTGQVISPDAAKALAQATIELASAWTETAQRRTQQYQSQANVGGVGDQFSQYLGGFQSPGSQSGGGSSANNLVENALNASGLSYDQALANIPSGKIGVVLTSTGQIGSILPGEFDANLYTKL